jgi:SAM-dependent methyltransferase
LSQNDPVERRRSFDTVAGTYHRGRPPYPPEVFELLASRCGLRPGARVLEIGAGTGQATGPLLAAGAHVVAIEPGASLAAILLNDLASDRLEVTVADFETTDLTGQFDLAAAATSFHWLSPEITMRKLSELVRPGGWIAIWWNDFGDTNRPTAFRDRLDEVYHDLLPVEPGYRDSRSAALDTERWQRVLTAGNCFGDVESTIIEWWQTLTAESARALWSTFPNIGELAPPAREQFLSRLSALIDTAPGGKVEDPRLTVIYTTRRAVATI